MVSYIGVMNAMYTWSVVSETLPYNDLYASFFRFRCGGTERAALAATFRALFHYEWIPSTVSDTFVAFLTDPGV
jgi:hypothetical protein